MKFWTFKTFLNAKKGEREFLMDYVKSYCFIP